MKIIKRFTRDGFQYFSMYNDGDDAGYYMRLTKDSFKKFIKGLSSQFDVHLHENHKTEIKYEDGRWISWGDK